jgi:transcriptional regulator with XRE-family HTH domain
MPARTSRWPSEQEFAQVVGSRIKELRSQRGLSQRALSQQLLLSKSMVAKYELGIHAPSLTVLVRLADLLAVTLDSLMGRDGPDRGIRNPRLVRCLAGIESMDAGSQALVADAIEAIVNAYRMLFARGSAPLEPR